jgi:hypothetical protein
MVAGFYRAEKTCTAEKVAAIIDSVRNTKNLEAEEAQMLLQYLFNDYEFFFKMFEGADTIFQIKTDQTLTGKKLLDVYHPLYITKRIYNLKLARATFDLLYKVKIAEKGSLISLSLVNKESDGAADILAYLQSRLQSSPLFGGPTKEKLRRHLAEGFLEKLDYWPLFSSILIDHCLTVSTLHVIDSYLNHYIESMEYIEPTPQASEEYHACNSQRACDELLPLISKVHRVRLQVPAQRYLSVHCKGSADHQVRRFRSDHYVREVGGV